MSSFMDYATMCQHQIDCESCILRVNGVCYNDYKEETIKMDRLVSRWVLETKGVKRKTYIDDLVEALPMCDPWYVVQNHLVYEFYDLTEEEAEKCGMDEWFKPMRARRNKFFK